MRRIIKNNYKIIIAFVLGICVSATTVYAVEAYIESKKVSYDNHNKKVTTKENVQEAIDELYERSGIHQEKWVDPILNGADPVLKDPLIPVEIKPNGDVYYANLNSEWYNYSEKRWANAIILTDTAKEYKDDKKYKVGDHILESDIESYFVWIPRYQYKVWDLGNYTKSYTFSELTDKLEDVETSFWKVAGNNSKLIDIQFGSYEKYPKMSEPSVTGVYYTHPAFTLGDKNLNGIWVGKFETARSSTTISDGSNIIIKPNVSSWRYTKFRIYFDAAKNYNTNLDSHMMKNTEWGAAAYLSHSAYGIGTEVNINNNGEYKTGYSATGNTNQRTFPGETGKSNESEKTQLWNSPIGYLASTTGNITGVYDMSGGAWEYVAACLDGANISSDFSSSELTNYMNQGYIDKYPSDSSSASFNKRILGDATGELGPFYKYNEKGIGVTANSWYADNGLFVTSSAPYFFRGGACDDGVMAGPFFFRAHSGSLERISFRITLSVN